MNNQDFSLQSAIIMKLIGEIAKDKGFTHQDIADATGFERTNVSRMFNGKYSPSLANFLKIINAINLMVLFQDKEDKVSGERMKDFLEKISKEFEFPTHPI